jgi:hypothetical protein
LPKALKTGLEREFFCLEKEVEKNKVNNDSWNFIENQIGQYHKSTLLDVFIERGHFAKDEIEEKAAEVAAYITLQNTIPTVLQNKHLLNFRTNCESAIDRSIKKTAEEKTNEEVSKSPSTRCIKSFVERLGNDKSKTNKEGWSR